MKTFQFKEYRGNSREETNIPLHRKILNNRVYRTIIGGLIGAFAGYLYWKFVGCNGGACPLTSNPYKTIGLFTIAGGLLLLDKKTK